MRPLAMYVGMDDEPVWPHWDCPNCDALNAGVEQVNPATVAGYGPPLCDECGSEMAYDYDASGEVGWCPAFPVEVDDETGGA